MATNKLKLTADVRVSKLGPSGRPCAELFVAPNTSSSKLGAAIEGITRDKDLRSKLGLKACPTCKSGFDIFIRDRFINEMVVNISDQTL